MLPAKVIAFYVRVRKEIPAFQKARGLLSQHGIHTLACGIWEILKGNLIADTSYAAKHKAVFSRSSWYSQQLRRAKFDGIAGLQAEKSRVS